MRKIILTLLVGILILPTLNVYGQFEKIWRYNSGIPAAWRGAGGNGYGGSDFWCVAPGLGCGLWDWMTLGITAPPPDSYVNTAMSDAASNWGIIIPPSLPTPDIETIYY